MSCWTCEIGNTYMCVGNEATIFPTDIGDYKYTIRHSGAIKLYP